MRLTMREHVPLGKRQGQAAGMPSAHAPGLGDVRLTLTRPITSPKWLYRGFGFGPFRGRVSSRQPPGILA
jgi:hypothetical protein